MVSYALFVLLQSYTITNIASLRITFLFHWDPACWLSADKTLSTKIPTQLKPNNVAYDVKCFQYSYTVKRTECHILVRTRTYCCKLYTILDTGFHNLGKTKGPRARFLAFGEYWFMIIAKIF